MSASPPQQKGRKPGTAMPLPIDRVVSATHDERARQRFVSSLRKRLMVDMAQSMRRQYERHIAPAHVQRTGHAPRNAVEVRRAMRDLPYFRAWSALRYTAQEMTWWSVQPQIERAARPLNRIARSAQRARGPASLRLNPALDVPRELATMDIHLQPGGFHTEFERGDVLAGALYHFGTNVFSAGLKLRPKGGGVARSVAEWLKLRFPQFSPRSMLDIGTTTGNNLFPYLDVFPKCAAHGIDVAAPVLRFAHAVAQARRMGAHFAQMDARRMDYEDCRFDLVVSSFFLHEQSMRSNRQVLREAYRVLRPGGIMVHMELPPAAECDPYYNFYLDWDAYYNNEPHYAAFRAEDPIELCVEAGFDRAKAFATRIPNYTTVPDAQFAAVARGELAAPAHGNGASWCIFGAIK